MIHFQARIMHGSTSPNYCRRGIDACWEVVALQDSTLFQSFIYSAVAGFDKNGDTEMAKKLMEEMQAAGLKPVLVPPASAVKHMESLQRKMKLVHLSLFS
jgi:pentatricopeptide repeat protein